MPYIANTSKEPWTSDFAKPISAQAHRPKWHPLPNQLSVMQRLVRDLFVEYGKPEDDFEVVE